MKLQTAAKINLFLEVEGKRADGYHDLLSVMQSVSLFDTFWIDFNRSEYTFSCSQDIGPVESNTVTRAWRMLKEHFNLPGEIHVRIEKRIPVGAGLAGGSANGAAVFLAANDHFGLGLCNADYWKLSLKIGSDMPFCCSGGTSLVECKGECISALPSLPPCAIVIVNGGFPVLTKDVFRRYDEMQPPVRGNAKEMVNALYAADLAAINRQLYNGLEQVTLTDHPILCEMMDFMASHGLTPLMTGSGPSLFALTDGPTALAFKRAWPQKWGKVYTCFPVDEGIIFE